MFEYTLIRSRRKTVGLQIKNGKLIVRAPVHMPESAIKEALIKNSGRIQRLLERSESAASMQENAEKLSEAEMNELKQKARAYIPGRVSYYAGLLGVKYKAVTIRAQHTRWGSCSSKGNLSFNCLLMLTGPEIIDAVVVHEVCHLKHMNHSKSFYEEISKLYPAYRRCEKWLKTNGSAIIAKNPE